MSTLIMGGPLGKPRHEGLTTPGIEAETGSSIHKRKLEFAKKKVYGAQRLGPFPME